MWLWRGASYSHLREGRIEMERAEAQSVGRRGDVNACRPRKTARGPATALVVLELSDVLADSFHGLLVELCGVGGRRRRRLGPADTSDR